MNWKWSNVPIPEANLVGLIIGTLLHIYFSHRLFQSSLISQLFGWPLIVVGCGICAWAVIEAKEMNIAKPNNLLKSGPYGFSRNPMYVGWALIHLGISFVVNSIWILALLPIAICYIQFVDIRKEEQLLDEQFGEEYTEYRKRVRRYF